MVEERYITQLEIANDIAGKALSLIERQASMEVDIRNLNNNFESHKHDIKTKLDKVPNEDRIIVLFAKEAEKIAQGLIKQIDDVKTRVNILESDKKAIKTVAWCLSGIFVFVTGIMIKVYL